MDSWPISEYHSLGANRRLRQCLCSSAISSEDRERIKVWLVTSQATDARVNGVIRWARNRAQGHDRTTSSLNDRIASTAEKIAYRLDEFARDRSKPIRPLIPKAKVTMPRAA